MIWSDIEADFKNLYPDLLTGELESGLSSCRWFYLPEGFKDQNNVFTFGFFKGENSEEARELLLMIERKAKEFGVTEIVGPLNLSTYLDYRLKLDFFEDKPYPGEPRNASWLPQIFEESGYEIDKRYFSNELKILQPRMIALALYGIWCKWKLRRYKYRVVALTKDNVFVYLDEMHQIVHEIFRSNHLYLDIPHSVFLKHVKELYYNDLNTKTSFVVLSNDGKCVGFTLNLLDRFQPQRMLFKTLGVKAEHRHKGKLAVWLIWRLFKGSVFRQKYCLACLALEEKSWQKKMSKISHKDLRYALYIKKIK